MEEQEEIDCLEEYIRRKNLQEIVDFLEIYRYFLTPSEMIIAIISLKRNNSKTKDSAEKERGKEKERKEEEEQEEEEKEQYVKYDTRKWVTIRINNENRDRKKTMKIVWEWMTRFPEDFRISSLSKEKAESHQQFLRLVQKVMIEEKDEKSQNYFYSLLEKKGNESRFASILSNIQLQYSSIEKITEERMEQSIKIFDSFSPKQFAEQITLLDYSYMDDIPRTGWELSNTQMQIMEFWCSRMIRWVCLTTLSPISPKKRARVYEKFVKIACIMRSMNNFFGLMYIYMTLMSTNINRLQETLSSVSLVSKRDLNQFSDLLDIKLKYKNLREAIKSSNPPLVPYLAPFMRDLIHVSEGMNTFVRTEVLEGDETTPIPPFDKDDEIDINNKLQSEKNMDIDDFFNLILDKEIKKEVLTNQDQDYTETTKLKKIKLVPNAKKINYYLEITKELNRFREKRYDIKPLKELQDYFKNFNILNSEDLYQLSLRREPKNTT